MHGDQLQSQFHRNEGRLQGLELHRGDRPSKCHEIERRVHRLRAGFDVDSATTAHVHLRSRDEKTPLWLKTLVERYGAKGKRRDDRSFSSRELCELDDAKIADGLGTAPSRRRDERSFGNTGQDDA